ncbi:hypothetical protein ABPG72_006893 [Tetrahymena utriculariae]
MIGNKQKYLLGILIVLQVAFCELQSKEYLKFYPLQDSDKSLAVFKSSYSHDIDLNSLFRDEYIFPSTLLDNLHLSNTKDFEIHAGCGSFNTVLFDKDSALLDDVEFPINGVQTLIYGDNVFYEAGIETLSELFKFSRFSVKDENKFEFQSKFASTQGFKNKFIYAQDPTDYICSDNIEKLKKYLPCFGNKGVFDLIDQTTLFRSSYVGIVMKVKIEKTKVSLSLQVVSEFLNSQKDAIFVSNKYAEACPYIQDSAIISGEQKIEASSKRIENTNEATENETSTAKLVYKRLSSIELPVKQKKNGKQLHKLNLIKSKRFMKNNWYFHEDALIHTIKNRSDKYTLEIETAEYLYYYFYPVFSQVKVSVDGVNLLEKDPYNKQILSFERLSNNNVLFKIKVDLKPNQEVSIAIPIIKMMKSFENYPYDPQRGHDIIAVPVIYRIKEQNSEYGQTPVIKISPNTIAFLPEPDFSMPFNIITFVCVLMGYIFLQIFRLATEKVNSEGHDDNILKKIIDLFRK